VSEESYVLENLDATSKFIKFIDSLIVHLETNIQGTKALSPFFPEKSEKNFRMEKAPNFSLIFLHHISRTAKQKL
jgi:hypothetical protein